MTKHGILAAWALAAVLAAVPQPPAFADSGLKLPRYASLRADRVNLRAGPGERYPIKWIFVARNLPIKIVGEFDTWRKVRDWEGTEGWIHVSMLSGRRTAMVLGDVHPLREGPDAKSPMVARVEGRVVGRVLECAKGWCRLAIGDHRGWMRRKHLWGDDPAE